MDADYLAVVRGGAGTLGVEVIQDDIRLVGVSVLHTEA
jgi:hypothetical protein